MPEPLAAALAAAGSRGAFARAKINISRPTAYAFGLKGLDGKDIRLAEHAAETPRWDFHKYLIGRNGRITASFTSEVEPVDARVIAAIEKELPPK